MPLVVAYVEPGGQVVHEQLFYMKSFAQALVKSLERAHGTGRLATDLGNDAPPPEILRAVLDGRLAPVLGEVAAAPATGRAGRRRDAKAPQPAPAYVPRPALGLEPGTALRPTAT